MTAPQHSCVQALFGRSEADNTKLLWNHPLSELGRSCAPLVLLKEGNGLFQGRILSYSDSDHPGFSALHRSAPAAQVLYLPGKYRAHLRKDTCGTSGNLVPWDIGSTTTTVLSLLGTRLESLPSREIKSKGHIWKLIQTLIKGGLAAQGTNCTRWPVGYKIPPGSYYTVFFISENQSTLWRRSTMFNRWESWGWDFSCMVLTEVVIRMKPFA